MRKYRFGDFELDLDAAQLRSNGEPVKLERRPLDLLILLIDRRGALVTREEIIAALWPAKIVIDFEMGVNTLVHKVRGALRDASDKPRFIETIPGRGYRFIAPVTEPPAADTQDVVAGAPRDESRGRWRAAALAASVVLVLAAVAATLAWQAGRAPEAETRIAVLPFHNLTADEELDYLSSGFHYEISASLSQIDLPELRVIGGASARAVADTLTVAELGRRLDTDLLLLGSYLAEGSRISVTSRLIRVADDEQIWTRTFDRELTNMLGVTRELSIAITEQIRQELSPEVRAAIARRQTENPEAYALYLKGRHAWNQLSRGSVREALQYFEQAADEDPTYALAWAGIAHTLITSPMTSGGSREAVLPQASAAMERALEHGADLAEVQYTLGYYRNIVEWDAAGAEQAVRTAIALDPNDPIARMFLGMLLSSQDRYVEALASLRRARELDPLFALAFANSALVAALSGDRQSGLELARQAVAIGPEVWATHLQLGSVLISFDDYDAALEAYDTAERYSGGNSLDDLRAIALARLGRESEARDLLDRMYDRSDHEYVSPLALAGVHANLGETESALVWLERALERREVGMLSVHQDAAFEPLHTDPRFQALLRQRDLARVTRTLSLECEREC